MTRSEPQNGPADSPAVTKRETWRLSASRYAPLDTSTHADTAFQLPMLPTLEELTNCCKFLIIDWSNAALQNIPTLTIKRLDIFS